MRSNRLPARGPAFWFVAVILAAAFPALSAPDQPVRAEITKAVISTSAVHPGDKGTLAVVLDVKKGFHAQSRTPLDPNLIKFDIRLDENENIKFADAVFPSGTIEDSPTLGKLSVYTGTVVVRVPFEIKAEAKPGDLKITGKLSYQVCDDNACYPPEKPKFEIPVKVVAAGEKVEPNEAELFPDQKTAQPAPPENTAAMNVSSGLEGSDWTAGYAFGAAFLAGLLFNIMPCVLPVLPIKAMGFYQAAQQSRSRSLLLGIVFSFGVIAVFTILAFVILVFKAISWGGLFSHGWFIWTIVIMLVAFAFSLFGAFEFRLPVGAYSFEPRHDTVSGNFLLGSFTAILATPCTAPLLPPLLLWAASQSTWVGVPAVIMVGVGMAFPYLLLSALPELAKRFPRTGPWSELFKQMMGFMLLAAAAYFAAGRLIHGPEFFWIVVAVVAVSALFMVARSVQLTKNAAPVAICSSLAILMLGGVLAWTARVTGLLTPPASIALVRGGEGSASFEAYSDARFEQLRSEGKPVLVKFTANWCATCQVIEGTVFRDPAVWQSIADHKMTALKVDLTDPDAPGSKLLTSLNPAGGIPLTAIYSAKGAQPILLASVYQKDSLLAAIDRAVPQAPQVAVTTSSKRSPS